jgi:hypothetical protein
MNAFIEYFYMIHIKQETAFFCYLNNKFKSYQQ